MRIFGRFWWHLLEFFVDDWLLAVHVLVWLALTWFATAWLRLPSPWSALMLFVGLAAGLAVNASRRARGMPPSAQRAE